MLSYYVILVIDALFVVGEKFHWSSLKEQQVSAYRRIERQFMLNTLDEYLQICRQFGVINY